MILFELTTSAGNIHGKISFTYNICENDRAQIEIVGAGTAGGKNTRENETYSDVHRAGRISVRIRERASRAEIARDEMGFPVLEAVRRDPAGSARIRRIRERL